MKRFFLSVGLLLVTYAGLARPVQQMEPLALARFVADRVVDRTAFEFEYVLQPIYPDIESIDFGRSVDDRAPGVAYALSTLTSEAEQEHVFEVGRTGPLKIWIDGQLVFERRDTPAFEIVFDEKSYFLPEQFTVRLREGDHTLLVKSAYSGEPEWKFLLQGNNMSRYAEKGKRIRCSLKTYAPKIKEAHWLVAGSFSGDIDTVCEPEKQLKLHALFRDGNRTIAWNIPRINLLIDNRDGGKFYNWSYHVGCFVWGLQYLAAVTDEAKYADYAARWCDYALATRPLAEYQTRELQAVRSMNFGIAGRPMLDYTSAPAMPFVTRAVYEPDFPEKERYAAFADSILHYLRFEQFRVDGIFARTYTPEPSVWADDMYMGIPFLLYSARTTTDKEIREALLDDAAQQVVTFSRYLQDPATGLYRQACYPSKPELLVPFWSRGNGWALWATVETLQALPRRHPHYRTLLDQYRRQVNGLLRYQEEDGCWRNVLGLEASVRESSGTAIFTLCLARGINEGWFDRKAYGPALERAWVAMRSFVDENGDFNGVKGGTNFSTDPQDYERSALVKSDTHGLLPLIFACIEMDRYYK